MFRMNARLKQDELSICHMPYSKVHTTRAEQRTKLFHFEYPTNINAPKILHFLFLFSRAKYRKWLWFDTYVWPFIVHSIAAVYVLRQYGNQVLFSKLLSGYVSLTDVFSEENHYMAANDALNSQYIWWDYLPARKIYGRNWSKYLHCLRFDMSESKCFNYNNG